MGNLGPKDGILYQTASQLPVVKVFLGSWTVDICQEGHNQRSAPQRRHTAHLRQRSHGTLGKLRCYDTTWDSALAKHLVA